MAVALCTSLSVSTSPVPDTEVEDTAMVEIPELLNSSVGDIVKSSGKIKVVELPAVPEAVNVKVELIVVLNKVSELTPVMKMEIVSTSSGVFPKLVSVILRLMESEGQKLYSSVVVSVASTTSTLVIPTSCPKEKKAKKSIPSVNRFGIKRRLICINSYI